MRSTSRRANAGDPTTCPFTPNIGTSGVYFSFDSGRSWLQPTYRGLTARNCLGDPDYSATTDICQPQQGDIGTLPGYDQAGLVFNGDPALAFGPAPDPDGTFSWANGSRLYYANLAGNKTDSDVFNRPFAVAVSRIDGPAATGLTPSIVQNQANWMAPLIVSKQSSTTFSEKPQIWSDDEVSSPFFGHVYACLASFRSNSQGNGLPQPLVVATSIDGGTT